MKPSSKSARSQQMIARSVRPWTKALKAMVTLFLLITSCAPPAQDLPTYTVTARSFSHQITAEGNLKSAKTTRMAVPQTTGRSVRLSWLRDEGRIEEGEVVARFDPTDMKDRLREGQLDLQSTDLKVGKTELQSSGKMAALNADLRIAELELEHAERFQKTDGSVFSLQTIIEEQIDAKLAEDRKTHAAASRQTQTSLNRTELDLLEIDKHQARLKIEQAEQGLQALEVRAPHGGLLTWARDWRGEAPQIGTDMWPSQEIAEIPDLGFMEAEVYVLEADAGSLEVGKEATVVVEARPEAPYTGRIVHVDAVAKPRSRSPVQYFSVRLEIETPDANDGMAAESDAPSLRFDDQVPELDLRSATPRARLKPGQRVHATLHIAALGEALVIPRQAVFNDGDGPRVYVRQGESFVMREVELGPMSLALAVINEGLEIGDVVALRRPPDASSAIAESSTAAEDEASEGDT